jgi:hypothetical protein
LCAGTRTGSAAEGVSGGGVAGVDGGVTDATGTQKNSRQEVWWWAPQQLLQRLQAARDHVVVRMTRVVQQQLIHLQHALPVS